MTAMIFLKLASRKLRLPKMCRYTREDTRDGFFISSEEYRLMEEKLSPMDAYLSPEDICLPSFDSGFWVAVRNKLRMSTAGILDLQEPSVSLGGADKAGATTSQTLAKGVDDEIVRLDLTDASSSDAEHSVASTMDAGLDASLCLGRLQRMLKDCVENWTKNGSQPLSPSPGTEALSELETDMELTLRRLRTYLGTITKED